MTHKIEKSYVESIIEVASAGATEPICCRLSSGEEAYVKYSRNRFGPRVLINEWIGNNIADTLGLEIPFFGECEFKDDAIGDACMLGIDVNSQCNGFCSIKNANLVPITEGIMSPRTKVDLPMIVLFHSLVRDCDSHEGNIMYDMVEDKIIILDSSHIIDTNIRMTEEELKTNYLNNYSAEEVINKNRKMYELLGWRNSFPLIDELYRDAERIVDVITEEMLNITIASMPRAWKELVGKQLLDVYRNILLFRVQSMNKIVDEIVKGEWRI